MIYVPAHRRNHATLPSGHAHSARANPVPVRLAQFWVKILSNFLKGTRWVSRSLRKRLLWSFRNRGEYCRLLQIVSKTSLQLLDLRRILSLQRPHKSDQETFDETRFHRCRSAAMYFCELFELE